jgi:hypothetical protein
MHFVPMLLSGDAGGSQAIVGGKDVLPSAGHGEIGQRRNEYLYVLGAAVDRCPTEEGTPKLNESSASFWPYCYSVNDLPGDNAWSSAASSFWDALVDREDPDLSAEFDPDALSPAVQGLYVPPSVSLSSLSTRFNSGAYGSHLTLTSLSCQAHSVYVRDDPNNIGKRIWQWGNDASLGFTYELSQTGVDAALDVAGDPSAYATFNGLTANLSSAQITLPAHASYYTDDRFGPIVKFYLSFNSWQRPGPYPAKKPWYELPEWLSWFRASCATDMPIHPGSLVVGTILSSAGGRHVVRPTCVIIKEGVFEVPSGQEQHGITKIEASDGLVTIHCLTYPVVPGTTNIHIVPTGAGLILSSDSFPGRIQDPSGVVPTGGKGYEPLKFIYPGGNLPLEWYSRDTDWRMWNPDKVDGPALNVADAPGISLVRAGRSDSSLFDKAHSRRFDGAKENQQPVPSISKIEKNISFFDMTKRAIEEIKSTDFTNAKFKRSEAINWTDWVMNDRSPMSLPVYSIDGKMHLCCAMDSYAYNEPISIRRLYLRDINGDEISVDSLSVVAASLMSDSGGFNGDSGVLLNGSLQPQDEHKRYRFDASNWRVETDTEVLAYRFIYPATWIPNAAITQDRFGCGTPGWVKWYGPSGYKFWFRSHPNACLCLGRAACNPFPFPARPGRWYGFPAVGVGYVHNGIIYSDDVPRMEMLESPEIPFGSRRPWQYMTVGESLLTYSMYGQKFVRSLDPGIVSLDNLSHENMVATVTALKPGFARIQTETGEGMTIWVEDYPAVHRYDSGAKTYIKVIGFETKETSKRFKAHFSSQRFEIIPMPFDEDEGAFFTPTTAAGITVVDLVSARSLAVPAVDTRQNKIPAENTYPFSWPVMKPLLPGPIWNYAH